MESVKPSWDIAPSWIRYLAQDLDGTWVGFEYQPTYMEHMGRWVPMKGKFEVLTDPLPPIQPSCEKRPDEQTPMV